VSEVPHTGPTHSHPAQPPSAASIILSRMIPPVLH
jgi:hypothetical protein